MGKNQSASNLPNIIQYNNGSINFVSGSTLLMQISSSGAITTTGVISGSNALSSSYASNSERLDNLDSTSFVFTSSYNSDSSSVSTRTTNLETASGSFSTRVTKIEGNYATTGSNIFLGAQTVCANITSTGTIIAQTLNVQQVTSSIVYSSGSNVFGCQLTDTQQMTGSLRVTGSFNVIGPSCISGCVNIATGNQIRLTNCARNNWVQIESPLVGGDAAIDFKLTTQSGVVYMNNIGVTCFSNAICAPRGEFTSDASCVPLRLINGVITGGSTTGVTALYLGDAGSGVSMLQREKYAANQANLVLYSEYGYNTQSINACMGYNGVALYTAGTKRLNIDGSGITCFSGVVCALSYYSNVTSGRAFGNDNYAGNFGWISMYNTCGGIQLGMEGSTGSQLITGAYAYEGILVSKYCGLAISANNGGTLHVRIDNSGNMGIGIPPKNGDGKLQLSLGTAITFGNSNSVGADYSWISDGSYNFSSGNALVINTEKARPVVIGTCGVARFCVGANGISTFSCQVCATTFRASSRIISNYTQIYDGDFSLNLGNTRSVVICGGIYTLGDFHLMAYGNAGTGMSSIRLSTYGYFANSNLLGFCEQLRYTFGSLTIGSVSNNGTSISFNIGNCSGSHNATGFWRIISLTGDSANSCVQVFIL